MRLIKVVLSDSMDTLQQPLTDFRICPNSTNMSIKHHTKHLITIYLVYLYHPNISIYIQLLCLTIFMFCKHLTSITT